MKRIILIMLAIPMFINGCSQINKKNVETTSSSELTAVGIESLMDGMFYVKTTEGYYKVAMGQNNLTEKNRLAKEADSSRIMSFTSNDALIPTLYKDEILIYPTSEGISNIMLERYKDEGWSVGFYNLQVDESSKIKYVIGSSSYDRTSSLGIGLAGLSIPSDSALIIIDQVGGKGVTVDNLSESGVIKGLKMGAIANVDLYVGTIFQEMDASVDTHVFSSMELYQLNNYQLNPEGYAEIIIPDYILSGYYFINGVGMFKYVANNRSEGIAGIDFSVPYFYDDENGKKITKEEYDALRGELPSETRTPSNQFTIDIDFTQKSYMIEILYTLKGNEDTQSLGYKEPTAEMISPDEEIILLNKGSKNEKQKLFCELDGMKSGVWILNVYNLENYSIDLNQTVKSGNADSFVHSGSSEGKLTIHTDGISGTSKINIEWQKSEHAVEKATIISPSGESYIYERNGDAGGFVSTYGTLDFPLGEIESGEWSLSIKGTDLGRVWLRFEKADVFPLVEDSLDTAIDIELDKDIGVEGEIET